MHRVGFETVRTADRQLVLRHLGRRDANGHAMVELSVVAGSGDGAFARAQGGGSLQGDAGERVMRNRLDLLRG